MPLTCPQCRTEIPAERDAPLTVCPACGHQLTHSTYDDETIDQNSGVASLGDDEAPLMPGQLGRYRIVGELGSGGFGIVYRAYDEQLKRDVAIKVPHRRRIDSPRAIEEYLDEARKLARLDHSRIVPVYDVGRSDEGLCFVVSKFVEGCDLATRMRQTRLARVEAVRIVICVAEALHHAHQRGLIHRDIKPSNIMLDHQGEVYLTDFGLALSEDDRPAGRKFAGTPAYMSPEQARGEGHRLDARSDIYSLGVVLYELLAGHWPFHGMDVDELRRSIRSREPAELAVIDRTIAPEISRICHKALSKRISDRYSTAIDLADELRECLPLLEGLAEPERDEGPEAAAPATAALASSTRAASPESTAEAAGPRVVPKGLRSFDVEDADFFLDLLPGPRDREGLPESIRFWKTRLEATDPGRTFAVGLIYGPSGCGKSSLVKAGLLPRLSEHVEVVYLEASPDTTEARLLKGLCHRIPELGAKATLRDALAALRRGLPGWEDRKVVIVLDQFEQWLHAHRESERPELAPALRHCDGARVQCLVMVRDDFWMAVTRFMREVEIRLVEGQNSAAVDLFSLQHARRVLADFGRAFGCLPPDEAEFDKQQRAFLSRSVEGLASEGAVIPVRLALLADMLKNRPWTPATLDEVGGIEGIGITFLEETFNASTAPPEHRLHQRAARGVLRRLIPDKGSDIKGHMRSRDELLAASGYAARPGDFDELLHILDYELRLVTPTDPEGATALSDEEEEAGSAGLDARGSYYQLTHDYLVPAIREWLVRKQKETRRGRAELVLEERAALWTAQPERRLLPSYGQWYAIKTFTWQKDWSEPQRRMMRAAGRLYTLREVTALVLLALLAWGGSEAFFFAKARQLADQLRFVATRDTPPLITQLIPYRRWAAPALRLAVHNSESARERRNLSLALLAFDPEPVDYLYDEALTINWSDFPVLRERLYDHRERLVARLWNLLEDTSAEDDLRMRAAVMLARYAPPENDERRRRWEASAEFLSRQLFRATVADPSRYDDLVLGLSSARDVLLEPLLEVVSDRRLSAVDKSIGTNIAAEYAVHRGDVLTQLLLARSDVTQARALIRKLAPVSEDAVPLLESELLRKFDQLEPTWADERLDDDALPDAEMVGQIEAADGLVHERFALCQTMPLDEFTTLVEGLRGFDYRPVRLRPYRDGTQVRVAAVWTRDNRNWRVEQGLAEEELSPEVDGPQMETELLVDVAAYYDPDNQLRYAAVWTTREPEDPEARAYLGHVDGLASFADSAAKGFRMVGLHWLTGEEGSPLATAVFWKEPGFNYHLPSTLEKYAKWREQFRSDYQVDVSVSAGPRLLTPAALYAEQAADYRERTRTSPNTVANWYLSGRYNFRAGNDEECIRACMQYIRLDGRGDSSRLGRLRQCHFYRSIAAARLQRKEQVDSFLQAAEEFLNDQYWTAFIRTVAAVVLGEGEERLRELELFGAADFPEAHWRLLRIARAYAFAAGRAQDQDPEQAARYTDRAVDYLRRYQAAAEIPSIWEFRNLPWFDSIAADPRVRQIWFDFELDSVAAAKYARQGDPERANEELQKYLGGTEAPHEKARVRALVAVYLGDADSAFAELETLLSEHDAEFSYLRAAAEAYAQALPAADDEQATRYRERALEILKQGLDQFAGLTLVNWFRELTLVNPRLQPLRDQSDYHELLRYANQTFAGVYHVGFQRESVPLHALAPQSQLEQARPLIEQGYRPVAISTVIPQGERQPAAASVWHRPLVTEENRDTLARRQATAAVALLRLGKPDAVWPLLVHRADPRVRSYLLHLLGELSADPQVIAERLEAEGDASMRRALILALGGFDEVRLPRDRLAQQLLQLYRDDPDPGVHAACGWVLREWNQAQALEIIDAQLPGLPEDRPRDWFVVANGHTMAMVQGPVEFQMGSPQNEDERSNNETLHRRQIPRSFAIGSHEVTIRQFQQFLRANPQIESAPNRKISPDLDAPVNSITALEAAQYCRWLSEQEEIPEDQMCYPPVDQIGPAMTLPSNYLTRTGYRLPTEAEWEFACRAGAVTSRAYGHAAELADRFAWTKANSSERAWPVGQLKPNEFGLFDMHGNVEELCHQTYPPLPGAEETEQDGPENPAEQLLVESSGIRPSLLPVARGGSYLLEPDQVRAARRNLFSKPDVRQSQAGFRIVRTLPLPTHAEALARRREAASQRNLGQQAQAAQEYARAIQLYEELLEGEGATPAAAAGADYAVELADLLIESQAGWSVLEPLTATSAAGATLTIGDDGSVLASGEAAEEDTYTLTFKSTLRSIAGFRLETLTDESLPARGPGRNSRGNFVVNEFQVAAGELPLRLTTATHTAAQLEHPGEGAIDGNRATGWAIGGATGLPQTAVFQTQPIPPLDDETELTITVVQTWGDSHTLGNFRISAASDPRLVEFEQLRHVPAAAGLSAWSRLALACWQLGQFERAIATLARASEASSYEANVYDQYLLALAHGALGRDAAAEAAFADASKSFETQSEFPVALLRLAEQAVSRRLESEPDNDALLAFRAALLIKLGQESAALADFRRALQLRGDDDQLADRVAKLEAAPSALWTFDFGAGGWRAAQARLTPSPRGLTLQSTGTNPNLVTYVAAPAGWKELTIRARTAGQLAAEVLWKQEVSGGYGTAPRQNFTLPASGDQWQNYTLYFYSHIPINELRFDPTNAAGIQLEIDSIVLRDIGQSGEIQDVLADLADTLARQSDDPNLLGQIEQLVDQLPQQAILAEAQRAPATWQFTYNEPPDDWATPQFDDSTWQRGPAGFGSADQSDAQTTWNSPDIWLRAEFELAALPERLVFRVQHDDDVQMYLNGVLAAEATGWSERRYVLLACEQAARQAIRTGRNVIAVHASNNVGSQYIDVGLYEGGKEPFIRLLSEALALKPDSAPLFFKRGDTYARRREWEAAARDYVRALQIDPSNSLNWLKAAALLVEAGDLEGWREHCREFYRQFSETTRPEVAERLSKAALFVPPEAADLEKYCELADRSVTLDPQHWALAYAEVAKALAEYRRGRFPGALDWCQKYFSRNENPVWFRDAQAHLIAALAHAGLQQEADAESSLLAAYSILEERAAQFRGIELDAAFHDWLICQRLRGEAAVAVFGPASEAVERAFALGGEGRLEDAAGEWSRAIDLRKDHPYFYAQRAQVYAQLGDWEAAAADYEHLVGDGTQDHALIARRATAYQQLQRWAEAADDWEAAAQLDPDQPDYVNHLYATCCERLNEWSRGVGVLDRYLALLPHDSFKLRTRGRFHDELKQWEQALADYDKALEVGSESFAVEGYYRRAVHWARRGQWQKAAQDMAEARTRQAGNWSHWRLRNATLILLLAGDATRAEQMRDELARQLADGIPLEEEPHIFRTILIRPVTEQRLDQIQEVVQHDWPDAPGLKALLAYRAGRFDQVATLLQQPLGLWELEVLYLRAMTQQQLGHAAEAAQLLQEANQLFGEREQSVMDGSYPAIYGHWQNWAQVALARREASLLIGNE